MGKFADALERLADQIEEEDAEMVRRLASAKAFHHHVCRLLGIEQDERHWERDFASVIEALRKRLEYVNDWVRVEDRLPEMPGDYEVVKGNWKNDMLVSTRHWDGSRWLSSARVTHWRRSTLPESFISGGGS